MKIAEAAGCPIFVGDFREMQLPDGRLFVVTDENVDKHVHLRIADDKFVIPPGEKSKSASQLFALLEWLAVRGADRNSVIVAVGGGVVGDLAGFAASVYMRGVRWAAVATSLLAQVDAAIGGKTAVDLPQGKNLVGAFHSPELVWIDIEVLRSLPEAHFRNGMAEAIKTAMVLDAPLVERLSVFRREHEDGLREIVESCATHKAAVVTEDPLEKSGRRAVLNFGHTIGHALEAALDYQGILHGEAVMIGMLAEAEVGTELGVTEPSVGDRLRRFAELWKLPTRMPTSMSKDKVMAMMSRDKKGEFGKIAMALPETIGTCRLVKDIDTGVVESAVARFIR